METFLAVILTGILIFIVACVQTGAKPKDAAASIKKTTKLLNEAVSKDKENKSNSPDYIYSWDENSDIIGGTNLDRFFVECILAGYTDFAVEKNIAKAELLAQKYNLDYSAGIGKLYERGLKAHEELNDRTQQRELNDARQAEKQAYEQSIRYAELFGKEKRKKMLNDQINTLYTALKNSDRYAEALSRYGQQKELNWGTWGGIASGIAGTGAGIATAIDVQSRNAQIRAQNEKFAQATMPEYMAVKGSQAEKRKSIESINKQLELLNEKLVANVSGEEVMKLLKVENVTVDVSETGAYIVTATVGPKKPLYMYDDMPAIADGTILAHVSDGNDELGAVKMVLPVEGVSQKLELWVWD